MFASIYLNPSKLVTVKRGHPWVYPKAIAKIQGSVTSGALVNVKSADEELIGIGVYNAHSLYCVRMLAYQYEITKDFSMQWLIDYRLNQAKMLRLALQLPSESTNAYRLFNSEADGLSGLTIDIFKQTAVVSSSAFWVQCYKAEILAGIKKAIVPSEIVWLTANKPLSQDGWFEGEPLTTVSQTLVLEMGIKYQVQFGQAQKTGLFLDQRENHQRIGALAKDKSVLDLYTYTGGFALHAALGGAARVTAVDSSAPAIAQAKHNAKINHLTNIDFIEADANDYLEKAGEYRLIILDPPKLVPSKRHLARAVNYYRHLHTKLFQAVQPGTLLLTCNCSSALPAYDFMQLVSLQARIVGKQVRIIGVYGPAACHPTLAAFPEGNYLTAILVAVL